MPLVPLVVVGLVALQVALAAVLWTSLDRGTRLAEAVARRLGLTEPTIRGRSEGTLDGVPVRLDLHAGGVGRAGLVDELVLGELIAGLRAVVRSIGSGRGVVGLRVVVGARRWHADGVGVLDFRVGESPDVVVAEVRQAVGRQRAVGRHRR